MRRQHGPMHRRALGIGLVALTLPMLLAAPAGAQSPSVEASGLAPTPGAPLIDPDSAAGRLVALRDAMTADRMLLAELRKDLPTDRVEAEAFLSRVEDLALTSDPTRLGVIVSRVRSAAPAWLDWRAGTYATTQEAADAYVRLGAGAFDDSWENLHDAALLTVVDRLDTIIDLADRIEDGR